MTRPSAPLLRANVLAPVLAPLMLLVALTLATPATALAQRVDVLTWQSDSAAAASYRQTTLRHRPEIATYDYGAVFRALLADLERSPRWTHREPVYADLHWALGEIATRFDAFDATVRSTDDVPGAVERFLATTPTGLFQQVGEGWFRDEHRVTFEEVEALPDSQALDFLERQHAVERLLTDFRAPAREHTLRAIHLAAERWRTFVERGRSAYPWEVWLNDRAPFRVRYDVETPPRRQWIVAHPELGVEVSTSGRWLSDGTASEALLVHLLGHVWYRWKQPAAPSAGLGWHGLSLAATLQNDVGPGFGVTAMYGPVVTAGAIWHDADGDGRWLERPPHVVLGIDLYRLARGAREDVPRALAKRAAVATAITAAAPAPPPERE